jgi:hypothetical protein
MAFIEGPKGGKGKWSQPDVPPKGWVCVGTEDLGEPSKTCEMREALTVRYVHHMRHTNWPSTLACGQICAGHMSEDLAGAKQRDKIMKAFTRQRANFPKHKAWHTNQNGNLQLKDGLLRVTIFAAPGNHWKAVVSNQQRGEPKFTQPFSSITEAQFAAFDLMNQL